MSLPDSDGIPPEMSSDVPGLSEHYILCGYGRVGTEIASVFRREGVPFVVIDVLDDSLTRAQGDGCPVVRGDPASNEVLRAAGIDRALGLVAATDEDVNNVYVTLSARMLRPDLHIVARANSQESESKLRRAGASRVLSPYRASARRIASVALRPLVVDFLDTVMQGKGQDLMLEDVEIQPDSVLANLTVQQAQEKHFPRAAILAVTKRDGSLVAGPSVESKLEVGDQLVVIGTPEQLRSLEAVAGRRRED